MVKISLQIKVTLENVDVLAPTESDFRWYLKFICSNCHELTDKWNYASLSETFPSTKGHSVNHYVSKCKVCLRENSMTILEDYVKPFDSYDEENFQTIAIFDCRGLEPYDFSPRKGWIVQASNEGTKFREVDLTAGEWADYCPRIRKPVSIYGFVHRFMRTK